MPIQHPPKHPGEVCTQASVSIRKNVGAKYRQSLRFGTPPQAQLFSTLRNFCEGAYGVTKDPHFGGIEDARRRRSRGQASANILLAFLHAGQNMRIIDAFLANRDAGNTGRFAGSGNRKGIQSPRAEAA